jgi:nucleotide-binding universal stress UspA family protein
MVRIQNVLCPVDLSAISERALRHGAALAAWYEARLTVLFGRTGVRVESTERDVAAFIHSAIGAHPAQLRMTDGDVVSEIVRLATGLPADLLVMGTHGISGFKQLLLGSVTVFTLPLAP